MQPCIEITWIFVFLWKEHVFDNRIIWSQNRVFYEPKITFLAFSHLRTYTEPPPPSVVVETLWKVRSVLNRTGNIIKKFSDFYFSIYHRKLGWFFHKNDTKMTITRKIKIGKIWNFVFISTQPIADLSSKFEKFQK